MLAANSDFKYCTSQPSASPSQNSSTLNAAHGYLLDFGLAGSLTHPHLFQVCWLPSLLLALLHLSEEHLSHSAVYASKVGC